MKNLPQFCLLLAFALLFSLQSCKKSEPAPEPIDPTDCKTYKNDTLQLIYPCDGQTDFIPNRFVWEIGSNGKQLEGFLILNISQKLEPGQPTGGLFSNYVWETFDLSVSSLESNEIALLPNTTYEWFMTFRHDGNGLLFNTKIQTFTTGETGHKLPTVFNGFPGVYTVQDTLYERVLEFISMNQTTLVDLAPVPHGQKKITISKIPTEIIQVYSPGDTITRMSVKIDGYEERKVTIYNDGTFFWGDGNYYTPTSLSGTISGDFISAAVTKYGYNNGTFSSHRFTGKK